MIVDYLYVHSKRINILFDPTRKKYYAKVTISYDPATRKQQQKKFTGNSIQEVKDCILRQIDTALHFSSSLPSDLTIKEDLLSWLTLRYQNAKDGTFITYEYRISAVIVPYIGNHLVASFSFTDAQKWVDCLCHKYSPATIHSAVSILRRCMQEHVSRHELQYNPCTALRLPTISHNSGVPLSLEEAKAYLQKLEQSKYREFLAVCFLTGMRLGEGLALVWDNIDFEKQYINIVATFKQKESSTRGKKGRQLSTKGNEPRRIYPASAVFDYLSDVAIKQLSQQYTEYEWNNPEHYIFTQHNGTSLYPQAVQLENKRILSEIGVDDRRFHDLRHTLATLLWDETHDIYAIMKQLGHKNVETTSVYIHSTDFSRKQFKEANNAIADSILSAFQ